MNDLRVYIGFLSILLSSRVAANCPEGYLSCGEGSPDCYHQAFICDGSVDCVDTGKDELDCETHTCAEDEFQCHLGNCIPSAKQCDHVPDCFDNSDEQDCVWKCDELREFKCARTGKCITLEQRCDGTLNCGGFDDSDEMECGGICGDRQFHCSRSTAPDRTCISAKWRCDGVEDCAEGEDEENCRRPCTDGLLCDSGTRCISSAQICDQQPDCRDGSDENPSKCLSYCDPPKWACGGQGYGYCINAEDICDGHVDCQDQSDEINCGENTPCRGGLRCGDGVCVPLEWKCDRHADCSDGSDELNCDVCEATEFKCTNNTCIKKDLVCNGVSDCSSDNDETHCLKEGETCERGFLCNSSRKCIPKRLLCDQTDDCGDSSDEIPGCLPWDSCSEDNGGCEHECISQPNSTHVCRCNHGYQLAQDGLSCLDIDECAGSELACSQFCTNTNGSYFCSCDSGYRLETNSRSCAPTDEVEPYIVFSNILEMRKTDLNGTRMSILFETTYSNIIDYDYRKEMWYWVSTESHRVSGDIQYETAVNRRLFNNSGIERIISDTHLVIQSLAVDWVTGILYTVGKNASGQLCVIDPAEKTLLPLITEAILDPLSIALDPRDGLMFWTDSEAGSIEGAFMDGSERTVLANNVGWANGITVDYARRVIIWIDAGKSDQEGYRGRIEEMTYSGHHRRVVKYLTPNGAKPWSITMFGDHYYWTDSHDRQEALIKCNRFNTTQTEQIRKRLHVPMGVKVVHPLRQPAADNSCSDKNCSHFCLLGDSSASCVCPEGLVLQNRTQCVPPTYEIICPSCPPNVPCVRVSSTGYECVSNSEEKGDEKNSTNTGSTEANKVGTVSWWICVIIASLVIIVIIIGIVGCKKAVSISCKPCINRLGQRTAQRTGQDYMQISLQATQTHTTEVWDADQRSKKESEI
ncbi:hypothetical protein ACHWQZ_G016579 [Mnemiopsis leidyi]